MIWRPEVVLGPVTLSFAPAVAKTAGNARKMAPVKTGALRRSIVPEVGVLSGGIRATATHAAAVNSGTRAHKIAPVSKKALAGKNWGPFKSANHPGTRPNPFMYEAAATFPKAYADELRRRL